MIVACGGEHGDPGCGRAFRASDALARLPTCPKCKRGKLGKIPNKWIPRWLEPYSLAAESAKIGQKVPPDTAESSQDDLHATQGSEGYTEP